MDRTTLFYEIFQSLKFWFSSLWKKVKRSTCKFVSYSCELASVPSLSNAVTKVLLHQGNPRLKPRVPYKVQLLESSMSSSKLYTLCCSPSERLHSLLLKELHLNGNKIQILAEIFCLHLFIAFSTAWLILHPFVLPQVLPSYSYSQMELRVTQAVGNNLLSIFKLLVVICGPHSLSLRSQVITQSQGDWDSAVFKTK